MKPKKTFSAYVLLIGVMSLAIVGGILAFQIFSASTKSQLTEKQRNVIKPIDGTINQSTIDNLEKRIKITEDEINTTANTVASAPSITVTPINTPTPIATQSATLSTISTLNEATPSADLTPQQ